MNSFIAVAIAAASMQFILLSAANASAGVVDPVDTNSLRADSIFRESNVVAADLPQPGQNPQTEKDELLAAIVSARISEPDRVAGVLNELRVESTGHLGRLDLEEWSEMMAGMRSGGVALGTRNKLRLHITAESSGSHTQSATLSGGQRRVQTGSGDEKSSSRSGRPSGRDSISAATAGKQASEQEPSRESTGTIFGVSGDSAPHIPAPTVECALGYIAGRSALLPLINRDRMLTVMALTFTALLATAGYVVQSKNATAADRAQHEIAQEAAAREQARGLVAIQLERVRSQMEAIMPLKTLLHRAEASTVYMACELGLEWFDIWGVDFVRQSTLWPHIEVWCRDFGGNPTMLKTMKGSAYKKYSPADIALLEDPAKRQIYIEAHTGCIAPCWREVATILATKGHLLEDPPATLLDRIFPDGIADWTKLLAGAVRILFFDMGAFVDAWAPLERRWEAGDFSRMQPAQPNPWLALDMVVGNIRETVAARQKELEGASSISDRKNATIDAVVSGVTASAQDDT
jgi:hypothetical protein